MIPRRITIGLFVGALLCFIGLNIYGFGVLIPGADKLQPFDLRMLGYSEAEVGEYLRVISDDARAAYLGPFRVLDTVFPVVLTLWLVAAALRSGVRVIAVLAVVAALVYGVTDLMENAAVAALLRGPAVPEMGAAAWANQMTLVKYGTLLASLILIAVGWKRR